MHRVTTLPSGLRVASEHMEGVRSVSVGFWIDAGARDERRDQRGLAHFIEHMLFKGGARHDATAIAELFDELGAELNAATAKDSTLVYARVLDDHLRFRSWDQHIFVDIKFHSTKPGFIQYILNRSVIYQFPDIRQEQYFLLRR